MLVSCVFRMMGPLFARKIVMDPRVVVFALIVVFGLVFASGASV